MTEKTAQKIHLDGSWFFAFWQRNHQTRSNSIAMRNFVSSHLDHCFCKYSKMPQNTSVTIVLENYRFHNAEHHHRGQAHKHARKRRQDDRRRTNRTHKIWRSATESPWTLWHTGGSRQGHPRYTSASTEGGRGWPGTQSTRHHHKDKTKVITPSFGYQQFPSSLPYLLSPLPCSLPT